MAGWVRPFPRSGRIPDADPLSAGDNELFLVVGADVSHCLNVRIGFFAPHIGPELTASCQRAGHGDALWMKTPEGLVFISNNGA